MAKPIDSFPESRQVDGNNVETFHKNPRPLEVEKGHRDWNDSRTGKSVDRPDYARDDD